jgi:RNA polymerase sigma-70 factor (ECF subfamily)
VYRTLGSYRSVQGAFATWLTRVTRNLLVDHYRRTRRDRLTDSLEDALPYVESKPAGGRTPDKIALANELSAQVQGALMKLSPDLREAVILRDLQGLDYAEIQQIMEVPEGTVKSRINRGRIEMAKVLGEMGVGPN